MKRFDAGVAGLCLGAWLVASGFLWLGDGRAPRLVGPGALFPAAAVLGWLSGNLYVARRRRGAGRRRTLLAVYLGGPPGILWLLWAGFEPAERLANPLAPLWALGVFGVFFLVPFSLRRFPGGRGERGPRP